MTASDISLLEKLRSIPTKPQPVAPGLKTAKVLSFDIETTPAEVTTYQLNTSWISPKNVIRPGDMLSWSAGWYHEPGKTMFRACWADGKVGVDPDAYHTMLQSLWDLLDRADFVVGWNSDRFDLQKVRGFFARAGMPPFRKPRSIDLMKTAQTFGFESKSLDYTARMLGLRRKIDNGGAALWRDALDDVPGARKELRRYNRGDVLTTLDAFDAMRPWIPNHPVMFEGAGEEPRCPRCGSYDVLEDGSIRPLVVAYPFFRCRACKGNFRGMKHHSKAIAMRSV